MCRSKERKKGERKRKTERKKRRKRKKKRRRGKGLFGQPWLAENLAGGALGPRKRRVQ